MRSATGGGRRLTWRAVGGCGLLAAVVIVALVRHANEAARRPSRDLSEQLVLAPTNAILSHVLVTEGELTQASAPLLEFSDAVYVQRVRRARAKVDAARLAIEELQLGGLETRPAPQSPGAATLPLREQATRDQSVIREQQQRVRDLTTAVTTLQAKLGETGAHPFDSGMGGAAGEADALALTRRLSELDLANAELKQLQTTAASRMALSSGAATAPDRRDDTTRSVQLATESLALAAAELDSILAETAQFSTTLTAPFRGQIIAIIPTEGTFVREGEPILILKPIPDA